MIDLQGHIIIPECAPQHRKYSFSKGYQEHLTSSFFPPSIFITRDRRTSKSGLKEEPTKVNVAGT